MNRRLILLAIAAAWTPVEAAAQVPTLAAKVCDSYIVNEQGPAEPANLTALYNAGDWKKLQERARTIIDEGKAQAPAVCHPDLLDYERNYVALAWIGYDPLTDKPRLMRVIVHEPSTTAYVPDLPGIGGAAREPRLVDLFISRSTGASLASLYTSTRENSPAAAQLPAFVQAIAGPLFGTVAAIAGPPDVRATLKAPTPAFAVTIQTVVLPFRRASVRLQASARDSVEPDVFAQALRKLATAVMFKEAAHSDCAREYAEALAGGLAGVPSDEPACGVKKPDPTACMKVFDGFLNRAYKKALTACGAARNDASAVDDVDQKFRDLIRTNASTSADLDITFHNRPPTHWSFGAGSAVIVGASLTKPRVELDQRGSLQTDPLTRVMTLAFVNWSPAGYDDQTDHAQPSERWRLFFGAALTPDFGPVGGLNVAIVRGVGITLGGGLLFAKGAEENQVGGPPPDSTHAFRVSLARVAFAGISYNFR